MLMFVSKLFLKLKWNYYLPTQYHNYVNSFIIYLREMVGK